MQVVRKEGQGSEKRKRKAQALVRLDPSEAEIVRTAANDAGLSVPAYMRQRVLGSPGPRPGRPRLLPEEKAIRELIGQLGYIGNNLNQLTRAVNVGDIVEPHELAPVLNLLKIAIRANMALIGRSL